MAQISDFSWHDLRHTAASYLKMTGVDDRTIMEIMGWKSLVNAEAVYPPNRRAYRRRPGQGFSGLRLEIHCPSTVFFRSTVPLNPFHRNDPPCLRASTARLELGQDTCNFPQVLMY